MLVSLLKVSSVSRPSMREGRQMIMEAAKVMKPRGELNLGANPDL